MASRPWKIPDLGFESYLCPRRLITPQSWYMLNLYGFYRDGHLPVSGGVTAQPVKIMHSFSIIAERRAHNEKRRSSGKKTAR